MAAKAGEDGIPLISTLYLSPEWHAVLHPNAVVNGVNAAVAPANDGQELDSVPLIAPDGDPVCSAQALGLVGQVAVTPLADSQSASQEEEYTALVRKLLQVAQVRVGGTASTSADLALSWLDIGASKVMLPSSNEALVALPRSRSVAVVSVADSASCDAAGLAGQVAALRPLVEEVLVSFDDLVGTQQGLGAIPAECLKALSECSGPIEAKEGGGDDDDASQQQFRVIVAGGLSDAQDVVALMEMNLLAQIGTALHSRKLEFGNVVAALARSDRPDGLYTTIVVDENGVALGVVYSDDASITAACQRRRGIYHSRRRGLWEKGLSSGAVQDLLSIAMDCDRDALHFTVKQHGAGFCHLNRRTCWSEDFGVGHLFRTLTSRVENPVEGSYTNRLLNDSELLGHKLREEAGELIEASEPNHVAAEAADVLYFAACICARAGVSLQQIERHLDRRSLRVRRRKGDAKPELVAAYKAAQAAAAASASAVVAGASE